MMAFTRPVVDTEISVSTFGQPVYDGMIRMGGAWRRASQAAGANVWTTVSFDVEIFDTNNFLAVPGTTLTVPAGCGGVYGIYAAVYIGASGVMQILPSSVTPESITAQPDTVTGYAHVALTTALPDGATVSVRAFSATAWSLAARFELWRASI